MENNKVSDSVAEEHYKQKQVVWYQCLVNSYIQVGLWQDKFLISMSSLMIMALVFMGYHMHDANHIALKNTSMCSFFICIVTEFIIMRCNKKYIGKLIDEDDTATQDKLLNVLDITALSSFIIGLSMLIGIVLWS